MRPSAHCSGPWSQSVSPWSSVILLGALATAGPAHAGEVHFEVQLSQGQLQLKLKGQETLFFPRVHVMGPQGEWWPIPAQGDGTQLEPDATLRASWTADLQHRTHRSGALRISFLDHAGVGFVQFGTLYPWPTLERPPAVERRDGALWIHLPDTPVSATWVLGGTGEEPLPRIQDRSLNPAQVLQWRGTPQTGSPLAAYGHGSRGPWLLIHEIADPVGSNFKVQTVLDLAAGPSNHPAWLNASPAWLAGALLSLLLAAWSARPRPSVKGPSGPRAALPSSKDE